MKYPGFSLSWTTFYCLLYSALHRSQTSRPAESKQGAQTTSDVALKLQDKESAEGSRTNGDNCIGSDLISALQHSQQAATSAFTGELIQHKPSELLFHVSGAFPTLKLKVRCSLKVCLPRLDNQSSHPKPVPSTGCLVLCEKKEQENLLRSTRLHRSTYRGVNLLKTYRNVPEQSENLFKF